MRRKARYFPCGGMRDLRGHSRWSSTPTSRTFQPGQCMIDPVHGWSGVWLVQCVVGPVCGWSSVWLVQCMVGPVYGWSSVWLVQCMVGPVCGWSSVWLVQYMVDAACGWSGLCTNCTRTERTPRYPCYRFVYRFVPCSPFSRPRPSYRLQGGQWLEPFPIVWIHLCFFVPVDGKLLMTSCYN